MPTKLTAKHVAKILSAPVILVVAFACVSGCGDASGVADQGTKYAPADDDKKSTNESDSVKTEAVTATETADSQGSPARGSTTPVNKPPVISGTTLVADAGSSLTANIPDGSPEEILGFIEQLKQTQPQSVDEVIHIQRTRIKAAEKILSGKAEPEVMLTAVYEKAMALSVLVQNDVKGSEEELVSYCTKLATDKDPEIARFGKLQVFGFKIHDFATDDLKDFEAVKAALQPMLADNSSHEVLLGSVDSAIGQLLGSGKKTQAAELMRMVGEGMKGNADVADFADSMLINALLVELDLETKFRAALEKESNAEPELIKVFETAFAQYKNPNPQFAQTMVEIAKNAEQNELYATAGAVYQLLGERFKSVEDEELRNYITQTADYGVRRAGLIGKPFDVSGLRLDGTAFDWNAYQGKVVLVDFWATWCAPCKMVAPAVEELAKEYEGKAKFVKVNTDENSDLATQYKIRGIPTLMFIKEGKIVDQVVGAVAKAQLKAKLDSLLG